MTVSAPRGFDQTRLDQLGEHSANERRMRPDARCDDRGGHLLSVAQCGHDVDTDRELVIDPGHICDYRLNIFGPPTRKWLIAIPGGYGMVGRGAACVPQMGVCGSDIAVWTAHSGAPPPSARKS